MSRRAEVLSLIGLLALLTLLNRYVTGSWGPPSGDMAIWYHCGLLMVIIGAYWVEHFFTKPADVAVNALIVFISVSLLTKPPHPEWWNAIRIAAVVLAVVACVVAWRRKPAPGSPEDASISARLAYEFVVRLGSAKVLFSVVFVLALISYFDLESTETKLLVIFWGAVVFIRHIELERLIGWTIEALQGAAPEVVGRVSRFIEPNIVRFELANAAVCPRGTIVGFTAYGKDDENCPLGLVVGFRRSPSTVEAEAIVVASTFTEGSLDHRMTVVKKSDDERLNENVLYRRNEHLVGVASRDTDIARLRFELLRRDHGLEEGHLVSVPVASELLFQIVNGRLHEELSIESGERHFTTGDAEQLGTWNPNRQGFETYGWVVTENAPVFKVSPDERVDVRPLDNTVTVGNVPNSAYPAKINLRDAALFHSAILGVTGSGKSFLAYQLIEACVAAGIKVICLDVTGDYKRWLRNAVLLTSRNLGAFLDDPNVRLGIIEFQGQAHPIVVAQTVSEQALKWCELHRRPEEMREPIPKILIVMEEAHALIPEWNSNPNRGHQDSVNKTAQHVLQARKYGLGFMIVTQRTANVTKSILNQCNTIFAFQAFDETGFEFMKNYMGEHYVRALPNLKRRQGVLVGKASLSDRPMIVRFQDQARNPVDEQIPDYQPPVPAVAAADVAAPAEGPDGP